MALERHKNSEKTTNKGIKTKTNRDSKRAIDSHREYQRAKESTKEDLRAIKSMTVNAEGRINQ